MAVLFKKPMEHLQWLRRQELIRPKKSWSNPRKQRPNTRLLGKFGVSLHFQHFSFKLNDLRIHEEFKNYMEEKLVPAVTTLSSPSVGSEIFLQMSLRSTTSITFGLSDGTHQLNVLNGALKGLKVVVGHDGIVLISKLRTKKFFPWKNLLLKSCRVFNGQVHDQII